MLASAKVIAGSSGLTAAVPTFQVAPDGVSPTLLEGSSTLQTYSPAGESTEEILSERLLLLKRNATPDATGVGEPSLYHLVTQLLEAA